MKASFPGFRQLFRPNATHASGSVQSSHGRQPVERVVGGRSRRARTIGFLRAAGQRVPGALVKGMVIALLVGGTVHCVHQATNAPAENKTNITQVAATTEMTSEQRAGLMEALGKAAPHDDHLWRDRAPYAGTMLNAYIEIPRDETTKHEFDLASNSRVVDRQLHESIGGYPTNYGFVPQTYAFDGDPFDVLVLGPPLPGGEFVQGKILGVMHMDDEKGRDPKVVISPVDEQGEPLYALTTEEMARIGAWFDGYKKPDAAKGKWSKVTGWGDAAEAKKVTDQTHDWFERGRTTSTID